MNIKLLIPRRRHSLGLSSVRRNPHWLIRLARLVRRQRRLISLYFFYRSCRFKRAEAWDMAGRTL